MSERILHLKPVMLRWYGKSKAIMSASLVLLLALAGLLTVIPSRQVQAAANTHYVDVSNGKDSNPGTQAAPWKSIDKAATSSASGDTVIIAQGIYRAGANGLFTLNPAGKPGALTTFKAAPDARVILTGQNDEAISITTPDYFRVEGLWFGGKYVADSKATPQFTGTGKEIIHCTFFGFWQGPLFGWTQNTLFQDNRLLDNGGNFHFHQDYFSSGLPGSDQISNHIIIDHNIVIGGLGYGLHLGHGPKNAIVSRNFVAHQGWGSFDDGSDNLWLNNFYWKEVGQPPDTDPTHIWGSYVSDTNAVYNNNTFGPLAWLVNPNKAGSNIHDDNNAFSTENIPNWALVQPHGKNSVVLQAGQEEAQIGISAANLDNTVNTLTALFTISDSRTIAALLTDATIEPLFSTITSLQIPAGSPLYQTGYRWQGADQPLDIGFNVPAPATQVGFWNAFRDYMNLYHLHEYDNTGNALRNFDN